MGTGINHLVRRAGCYWWRRQIPRVVAIGLEDTIARSLRTADPLLARRRARRCSAAFDAAMMRLGEIVQLRVADVRREAGVDFFDLSEEGGRKLKTEAGARQIPIHPALVDAGILELVSARRAAGVVDLLPRAPTDVGHQRPTNALSKWFGRFRHGLGITSPGKTFHATRHTFADALRSSADGRYALCDQILGHEPGGVGARVYTRALPLARKYGLVASVDYRDAMGVQDRAEPAPAIADENRASAQLR